MPVQERYGQLAKKIVGRALPSWGALYIEHEIPIVDAQAGDVYFVPEPGRESGLAHLGWFGRLASEPCLLEMIQSPPGARIVRGNVRKQLTLDHSLSLEAGKKGQAEPRLPHLWMLSAGRPREVLEGYDFRPAAGWPPGVWVRSRLDAVGIVVLSELPRQRDTLLLRLLGRGKVLADAITDLKALPPEAVEREIAHTPLVALRFEVAHDPNPDQETRAFLMATQDLFDEWVKRTEAAAQARGEACGEARGEERGLALGEERGKAKGRAEGEARGVMITLTSIYEGRFGPMPERVRKALAKKVTVETVGPWSMLFITATSPAEIASALRKGDPRR